MPSVASPFGLKAKHSPSGIVRPQRWVVPASDIITNAASWGNLYQDDAVYIDSSGRLQVTGTGSTAASACIGSFSGVEFNDSNGRRTVSNQFQKSLIANPAANQGLGTTDVWFWLYTDPELIFELQVNGSLSSFAAIGNGLYYDQNTSGVNSTVGFSAGRGTTSAGSATQPSFVVYNLAYDYNPVNTYTAGTPTSISPNAWNDAFPNVLVKLANAQFNGVLPAF